MREGTAGVRSSMLGPPAVYTTAGTRENHAFPRKRHPADVRPPAYVLALPRFSGALRRVLATSVFNAALIVEGELGLLSRGFSAHISAQRLVRLLKSESVME